MAVIQSIIAAGIFINFAFLTTGLHKCEQGTRCVYKRGGIWKDNIGGGGWNYQEPYLTSVHSVKVVWDHDKVPDVACISNQGSIMHFDVYVINKLKNSKECILKVIREHGLDYDKPLIFDVVPTETAQFCKDYTIDELYIQKFDSYDEMLENKLKDNIKQYGLSECIEISKVLLKDRKVSAKMQHQYEITEVKKKEQEHARVLVEKQKIEQEAMIEKARREKEQEKMETDYKIKMNIATAESEAKIAKIASEADYLKKIKHAEALAKAAELEAAANKKKLTPEYLELQRSQAYYHNSKIHTMDPSAFGDSHRHMHYNKESGF
tara:strand:- start:106 stop:1071 length:966 start_codon:yes stop_codon:yes gene_type:complete